MRAHGLESYLTNTRAVRAIGWILVTRGWGAGETSIEGNVLGRHAVDRKPSASCGATDLGIQRGCRVDRVRHLLLASYDKSGAAMLHDFW